MIRVIRVLRAAVTSALAVLLGAGALAQESPAAGEEPISGELDLGKVDLSDVDALEFHGRLDLAYVHFESRENVDDFRKDALLPISSGLYAKLRALDWLFVVAEVEYDGHDESVEVDQAVIRADLVEALLTVRVGRYYFPFGLERSYYSPSRNMLVDRPAAFRRVYPGTYADNGLFVEGQYTHHTAWTLGWEAAVTQGLRGWDREDTPKTLEDNNDTPQLGARVTFQPRPELTFGVSYTAGYWDDSDEHIVDFFGFDGRLEVADFEIRAEYVGGRVEKTRRYDDIFRQGWYFHVEREFELELPWFHSIIPVMRVDWIDPNLEVGDFLDVTRYCPGLAFVFNEHVILKTELSISDERGADNSNNGFLTQLVIHW